MRERAVHRLEVLKYHYVTIEFTGVHQERVGDAGAIYWAKHLAMEELTV
jgi:hypothetical protein